MKTSNSVHSLTILLICILSLFPRRDLVTERFKRDYYASGSGASQIILDLSFEISIEQEALAFGSLVFGLWCLRQNITPIPKAKGQRPKTQDLDLDLDLDQTLLQMTTFPLLAPLILL